MASLVDINDFPHLVKEFSKYKSVIAGSAEKTVNEYLLDLRTFFRYLYAKKNGLKLSQNQFDALVSFTYNLGTSSLNKTSYTIVDAVLNAETENELIYAFSIYCMAGGEFQPGLMRRRLAEANMYLNGVYSRTAPENYCYVRYNGNGHLLR